MRKDCDYMQIGINKLLPDAWKKDIWLSKLSDETQMNIHGEIIKSYEEPIKLKLNYQPLSSQSDIASFGMNSSGIQKAVIKINEKGFNLFKEFDLVYLDGASPTNNTLENGSKLDKEQENGDWANYRVHTVKRFNLTQHVYFIKTKGSGVK